MMAVPPAGSKEIRCPCCERYLGTIDGTYVRFPPCVCGWQWVGEAVGKRARQCVEMAGQAIEVKSGR